MNIIKCFKNALKDTLLVIVSLIIMSIILLPIAIGVLSGKYSIFFSGIVLTLYIIMLLSQIEDRYGYWLINFIDKLFGEKDEY